MKIGEFITGIALVAFVLALCTIESLSAFSIITMFLSGGWILGYAFLEEEKRMKEGRR